MLVKKTNKITDFSKVFLSCSNLTSAPARLFENHRDGLIYPLEDLIEKECIPELYAIIFALKKVQKWQIDHKL